MHGIRHILRNDRFLQGAVLLWLVKLVGLFLSTPLYDLDTNSFIRGGLSWDIYHNPFMNIYLATAGKVWSNAWFIVGIQCLVFALCTSFLVKVLFDGGKRRWWWLGLGIAAIEPLTTFYNYSFLAESFFISFTFLSIAFALLWLRDPKPRFALLFGLAMGLTFMCKLSAVIHLPLFGMFLLRGPFLKRSTLHGLLSLIPFLACYFFVFFGQKAINEGDLYTVEGRVRWDFSSALYDSSEVEGPAFKRFVHPYLYTESGLVEHRELRRELSYLGYKDCVAEYESQGVSHNRGVNACDSIFGAVAGQVMEAHFWEAEAQFVHDNFRFVHELNYIDYRFTPGLHYYHPASEWQYLDSLMAFHYGVDLSHSSNRIPRIWTSLEFGNVYMPLVWWLWWAFLVTALVLWWRNKERHQILVLFVATIVPLIFHFVYISYRPRFLAPYIVLVLYLGLLNLRILLKDEV